MGQDHSKDQWEKMGVPNFEPIQRGNPHWMPIGKKCRECANTFNVFVWPRHCESCGSVFCQRCCYKRPILHGHLGCGMCVAEASVIIRQHYESKRERQMHDHNLKYHPPPGCKCEIHSPTTKKSPVVTKDEAQEGSSFEATRGKEVKKKNEDEEEDEEETMPGDAETEKAQKN